MGEENVDEIKLYFSDPEASRRKSREELPRYIGLTSDEVISAFKTLLSPLDAAVLTGDFAEWLVRGMDDGLAPGDQGWWDDGVAHLSDWEFALDSIRVPVKVWHGRHDRFVPLQHGQWLGVHVPGAESALSETEGHLTLPVGKIGDVHEWLLSHFQAGEVAVEFVGVGGTERAAVLGKPITEGEASERRGVRDQRARHQAADLVRREDDVAHEQAERACRAGHHDRRDAGDRRAAANRRADRHHELPKRHRLGPRGIEDHIGPGAALLDADASDVESVDWLHQVAPVARDREQRHPPQDPGDVVCEHVAFAAEDQGGPHDRIRDADLGQRPFDKRLAPEVRQRRLERRDSRC